MTVEQPEKRKRGRPRTNRIGQGGGTVQALDRGLMILRALARGNGATLSDLALLVGMPPSTAYRLLATLQNHGFVEFDEITQEWAIGIGSFRIGSAYLVRTNMIEASRTVMHDLMQETGETANLGIAEDGHVIFVSQVETHNPIRAFFRPGTRSQMHASGIGKALLASMSRREVEKTLQKTGLPEFTANTLTSPEALFSDLDTSAGRGWSLDDEERYSGMRCVAAPIFNAYGEAVAGVSVSGPAVRFTDEVILNTGPMVRKAADSITEMIGGKTPAAGV
jgi:IclR family transcriptional regulator, acetate operon repressor